MTVRGIELTAPATAGERFAFSVQHEGYYVLDEGVEGDWAHYTEIWGTNERCGLAMELLWWGPERSGIYCGEFTPSASYSHLLHVRRQRLDVLTAGSSDKFIALCNAGSCPSGAEGQGLEPGGRVEPPLVYGGGLERAGRRLDVRVGAGGRLLLVLGQDRQPLGTPENVQTGYFRMPANDRFGDAWYCIGDQSTITEVKEPGHHLASLRNITRLASCDTPEGSGTASLTVDNDWQVEASSSFADWNTAGLRAGESSCSGSSCAFHFYGSTPSSDDRRLFLDLSESVGTFIDPITTPVAVTRAALFQDPRPDAPIQVTCTLSGTISYDSTAITSVSLDSMSEYFTCPGEPVEDGALDFEFGLEW